MLRSDISRSDHGRFDTFYVRGNKDECWLWLGSRMPKGYGRFHVKTKTFLTHRVSYIIHYGDFDQSLDVLHKCDEPLCVNPNHLWLGTQQDNMEDMVQKGRQANGQVHGRTKIPETEVPNIREMYASGEYSLRQLAKIFGCTPTHISDIVNYKKRKIK